MSDLETNEVEPIQEYLFGIPIPSMNDNVQPLECLILIKGIDMETGGSTMTTIVSEGVAPWESLGMLSMEIERIKFMTVYTSMNQQEDDEE